MTYIKLDEAIAAIKEEIMMVCDDGYNTGLRDAMQTLRDLPTVSVTDEALRIAAQGLIDDVHSRHHGEELRCPHMIALESAIGATVSDGWEDIANVKGTDGMILCAGKWPDGTKWRAIGQAFDGWASGDWDDDLEPTHWRPLPAPPTIGE